MSLGWSIANPALMPAILQSADELATCRLNASRGEKEAQFQIGYLYFSNRGRHLGIKKNHRRAARWLRRAGLQGHAEAQYYLGVMYRHGLGVHTNRVRARRWLERAACQGQNEARTSLAIISRSRRQALRWLRLAAEDGYVPAMMSLVTSRRYGMSREERFRWLKEATRRGSPLEALVFGRTGIELSEFR